MVAGIQTRLARRLRQLRKEHGYTQQKLAEKAEIDYKYLQRLEGKSPPAIRITTLAKLARAFRISASELLDF